MAGVDKRERARERACVWARRDVDTRGKGTKKEVKRECHGNNKATDKRWMPKLIQTDIIAVIVANQRLTVFRRL